MSRCIEAIEQAAAAYIRHGVWRKAGKPPCKCPKPTGGDIIDRYLDERGVTDRSEREHMWAEMAGAAFELAENLHGAKEFRSAR